MAEPISLRAGIVALIAVFAASAHAEYVVTGPAEGTVCTGLVIEACGKKTIVALEDKNGMYPFPSAFKKVDEHNDRKGWCTINTSSNSLVGSIISRASLPTFYTKEDGVLKAVSPDYITFSCRKTGQ